MVKIEHY